MSLKLHKCKKNEAMSIAQTERKRKLTIYVQNAKWVELRNATERRRCVTVEGRNTHTHTFLYLSAAPSLARSSESPRPPASIFLRHFKDNPITISQAALPPSHSHT